LNSCQGYGGAGYSQETIRTQLAKDSLPKVSRQSAETMKAGLLKEENQTKGRR